MITTSKNSKKKKQRMLPNGRSKYDGAHIRHYPWQMKSAAWKSLLPVSKCLEMELKALYNGMNNGELFLSIREAAKRLGVSPNTARNAFKELEEKGFILPSERGNFNYKLRHASSWILTEFSFKNALATKDFMRWEPKEEKTRTQNLTPTVSKPDTATQNLIPNAESTVINFNTVYVRKRPFAGGK